MENLSQDFYLQLADTIKATGSGKKRMIVESCLLDRPHIPGFWTSSQSHSSIATPSTSTAAGILGAKSYLTGAKMNSAYSETESRANILIQILSQHKAELGILDFSILRNVEDMKVLYKDSISSYKQAGIHVEHVFLIRAYEMEVAKLVCENICELKKARQQQQQQKGKGSADSADASELYTVFLFPRMSSITKDIFQAYALLDSVRFVPLAGGFFPVESDVLVLDLHSCFRDLRLYANHGPLLYISRALESLEYSMNLDLNVIRSVGGYAREVCTRFVRSKNYYRLPQTENESGSNVGEPASSWLTFYESGDDRVDSVRQALCSLSKRKPAGLVVIDRSADPVSCLVTQWTYEGLLDEIFGVHHGVLDIQTSELQSESAMMIGLALDGSSQDPGYLYVKGDESQSSSPPGGVARSPVLVKKNMSPSQDKIFAQLRDLNFSSATKALGVFATSVREYYRSKPDQVAEVKQVQEYLKHLKEYQVEHKSVSVHTALASEISARTFQNPEFKRRYDFERDVLGGRTNTSDSYILDIIAQQQPIISILRLLALWTASNGGIPSDRYTLFYNEMLAAYGSLTTLRVVDLLERSGLLYRSQLAFGADITKIAAQLSSFSLSSFSSSSQMQSPVTGLSSPEFYLHHYHPLYSWQVARSSLKLLNDFEHPASILNPVGSGLSPVSTPAEAEHRLAGCFSGYIPLMVRLAEAGMSTPGWSKLPKPICDQLQISGNVLDSFTCNAVLPNEPVSNTTRAVLNGSDLSTWVVFVIGGITKAEISCLRWLALKWKKTILVASTHVTSGNSLLYDVITDAGV